MKNTLSIIVVLGEQGVYIAKKYDSTFFEALALLKQKYFPPPTRAITLGTDTHTHLRPPALVGLSQKYFKRLPFVMFYS